MENTRDLMVNQNFKSNLVWLENAPRQAPVTHDVYSELSPEHIFSSDDGLGFVQVRVLCLIPCPHVLVQADHCPQGLQPPNTDRENYWKWVVNIMANLEIKCCKINYLLKRFV